MTFGWTCQDCGRRHTASSLGDILCECQQSRKKGPSATSQMAALTRAGHHRGRRNDCLDSSGKPIYFPNKMEANYWRYLRWIQERGEIERFEYHPTPFDWADHIRHGINRYQPDFRVWESGCDYYVETKGFMDRESKTKLRRLALYNPDVELRLVTYKDYQDLARQLVGLVPGWE